MPYLYLAIAVLGSSGVSIASGYFARKTVGKKGAQPAFLLMETAFIFLAWTVMYLANPSFDLGVLPYSVGFGAFLVFALTGSIKAISNGSVAMTALVNQSSMIAVSVWGLLFWGEVFTWQTGVGLVLVLVALCLCLMPGKGEGVSVTGKWLLFATMLFVGNAGASIVQRSEQMAFQGAHGNMLMCFALLIGVAYGVINFLRSDRSQTREVVRAGGVWPVLAGGANVAMNVAVILLATTTLPASLIYPAISIGGLAFSTLYSRFVFGERLSAVQWLGMGLGVTATLLLA